MHLSKNRTTAATIATFLVLSIAVSLAFPVANAHSPPWSIPTWTYCTVSPNPIGVNQQALVIFWLSNYPITAQGAFGDRWTFTVEVTKPDGSKETLGPYKSDPVGGSYASYTPTQVGTYKFVAKFAGHTYTGQPLNPAYSTTAQAGYAYWNDTMQPSESEPYYLTVTEAQVQPYEETPLPEGFWTRPINGINRNWYLVASNWLSGAAQQYPIGGAGGTTTPYAYGSAPESPHIMWTRQYWDGGIMDYRYSSYQYYTGLSYEGYGLTPPIILNGRLYYNVNVNPRFGWYCVDLYTGETLFFHNTTGPVTGITYSGFDSTGAISGEALAFGQIYNYESPNQHGGFPYLWSTGNVGGLTGTDTSVWMMFDAFTGNYICSIGNTTQTERRGTRTITTGATGTAVYGKDGSILRYNIVNLGTTTPDYYLQVWNTSRALWVRQWTTNTWWMWRPYLNWTADGRNGFSLNASIPAVQGSIYAVRENEYIIGGTQGQNDERGIIQGNLWALNLKPAADGSITPTLLWNITFTPPLSANYTTLQSTAFAYHTMRLRGVYPEYGVFEFTQDWTRERYIYSLSTGQLLWKSEPELQWNMYGMNSVAYDGKLFGYGYSGQLIAYNITTGKILWNWTSGQRGFETWYENAPLSLACIADGKIYLYSSEHSPSVPLRRDAFLWCIDANTGELLWKSQCWPSGSPAIADGYLVTLNLFDNQIYCYGKGPSATTVSAPQNVITVGQSVMITGTVTDQTPSPEAKGTAAISDENMEEWMEYLYMQRPCPGNAKGVEVTLDALDPNGNFVHIGTVTSDITGAYGIKYTPEVPGTYQIIATFAGSKSYGSSFAQTYLGVDEAPPASPPPEYPQPIDNTMTIVYATIAIIITVVLVGILLLRKK
ncbi:MAG: PQQ-binding-like beta-propeller repeat protein [Candidatus Bathyarchaeota archaeon]|nr:PQQ-binding-like beta-propeller repeat protein [Candidatus Bathyarchaeota archaeon]